MATPCSSIDDGGPTAVAVIAAAGRGRRMGDGPPKQYRLLGGQAVLWHAVQRFQHCHRVHGIVPVIHAEDADRYAAAMAGHEFDKLRAPVLGGAERVDSVRAALEALTAADDLVLIHDAVRPWVTAGLIERVAVAAAAGGAAIPAVPVTETIKVVEGGIVRDSPRRSRLWAAQTPQGFRRELLVRAFAAAPAGEPATDESSMVERIGAQVRVVEGEYQNVKITTPEDLQRTPQVSGEMRVGTGYDVHAFADGRRLVLGGVDIAHELGLAGHSDADVLTHAVIDALLGAAGLGDIGRFFPDTDAAYAGISSLILLERVRERLREAGARVVNVDAVVMAQAPRLNPHVEAMVAALAHALRIDPRRVWIKATTTEGLGFVGRREGIAAQAVALLQVL